MTKATYKDARTWLDENPRGEKAYRRVTREHYAANDLLLSIGRITEECRARFKISIDNSLRSWIARILCEDNPKWAARFRFRKLVASS